MLSPVPPIDLVGANRTVLAEGDGPLRLARVWRNEWTGELLDNLERFQDAEEAKVGLTAAHVDALRFTTAPKGLAASSMTAAQHEMLTALLGTYVGRLPDEIADARDGQGDGARRSPPSTSPGRAAWIRGRPHYYRIQGHRLLVEYDNTTRGANHVHSVWRDPVGDFGMDLLGAHRRAAH